MSGIVVGVDGSSHSMKSLDWALDEAAFRNTSVTVLAVAPAATGYWGIYSQYDPAPEVQEKVHQKAEEVTKGTDSSFPGHIDHGKDLRLEVIETRSHIRAGPG